MAETGSGPEQDIPAASSPLPDAVSLGVGNALRKRREQLGWTLPQVAAWLRIRESYLEALESGRSNVFPAEAYALGFLRTYAEAIGFDASFMVARYRLEGKGLVRKPELTFPAPPPDKHIPPALTVSLGIAVVVGAYMGWYHFMGHAPPVPEHVPPVAEIIPGEKTANAPSPQVASLLPGAGSSPLPTPKPVTPPEAKPTDTNAPEKPGTTVPAEALLAGAQQTQPTQPVEAPPAAPTTAEERAASARQMAVKADAATWVQVKDSTGRVVYDHIMQPGDVWMVPSDSAPYSLTVGNAGGVVVSAGTQVTPHLGRNGAVRRNLVLTPEVVLDGSLAGPPTTAALPVSVPPSEPTTPKPPVTAQSVAPSAATPEAGVSPAVAPVASDGSGQNAAPPVPAKPRARKVAPKPAPEMSTDDLNARQLQGITGH
ncbi:helix-turn-helix domain-containing protein [Acetobacter cibinongensis]|uniref:Cytoskeleton protein RodZ-like C-terminal domain-containing protein n=1 Tax=Acetobacter cibinongensis TaxID=146475 RepID=A0A1Z5YS71_9PROT|nr:RodZ domain-containing protein [Acetobacter cibinongensis]OUJ00984.1 hypothetical protein HK14_11340 [Acetobacter cibinongensis]